MKNDNDIPPEVLDILKTIGVDSTQMQELIDHGVDHSPPTEVWDVVNDALEGQCEVGNAIMLLALVMDTLSAMGLSMGQQSLLMGIYASIHHGHRSEVSQEQKETDPKLN